MRVDSSGSVRIGNSTLTTNGSADDLIVGNTSGNHGMTIFTGTDSDGAIYFGDTNTTGTGNRVGSIIYSHPDNHLRFSTNGNIERLRISSGGELYSVPTYSAVTTNAANVYIASNGNMSRSSSSRKYKTNIETLEDQYADRILDCRPVWYRSTTAKDNPDHGYWGFIAEEVAEIDPRLVHWKTTEVTYDENGSSVESTCGPEPEGVQYDRFVPHLLNLIKRQKEQIEAMEARLSALEAQ
tara:strand:+ start:40 stop:756 length:717 start_codon:yes stop_codon:yes gene_type:complete